MDAGSEVRVPRGVSLDSQPRWVDGGRLASSWVLGSLALPSLKGLVAFPGPGMDGWVFPGVDARQARVGAQISFVHVHV